MYLKSHCKEEFSDPIQGRIQDFKLEGAHLKKFTILRQISRLQNLPPTPNLQF